MRRGDLAAAAALVDQAPPNQRALLRAEVLLRKHDLSAAHAALDTPAEGGDPRLQARRAFLQGWSKLLEGHAGEALEDLDEASRSTDIDANRDANILAGVALFQLHQEDAGFSRLRAVQIESAAAADAYHEALALNNLGFGELARKRYDAALPWFERVLAMSALADFTIYADALNNAGICYSRLGQFDRAVATQQRAIALHERGSRREYEQALGQLGATYLLEDNVRAALPFLERAREVAAAAGLSADAALWAGNLASGDIDIQDWDAATRLNEEARKLKTLAGSGSLVYNTLNAAQIAEGRGKFDEAARLYADAKSVGDAEPSVRWNAEAGLAHLDMARQRPADAARHFEAALTIIEQTRSDLLKTDYKLSFLTELITFYRSYVDALVSQHNIDRALEVADSSRARVLAERQGIMSSARIREPSLERRARTLHAVFLSYWLAPGRSYLWIVTGAGTTLATLPSGDEIDSLVKRYRAVLDNAMADPLANADGRRLYDILLAPAAEAIAHAARVIIVPDAALYGLNFETLPVDATRPHYWIEDADVQVAPSLELVDERAAPPQPEKRSLLLVGNPDSADPAFPKLSYAAAEMNLVARTFSSGQVASYDGAQASPASYRDAHPERFAFVHFSAHATTNVDSPLDSAVILSGPPGASKLYARDVADEPLHAELVTISACRSAGERTYAGEGLVGFAWAFLRAGAKRVVAGLWDVDDRSTADLMGQFYAGIAAGRDPADALRRAKLSILSRGGRAAAPYYWAPFELFTASP